MLKHPSSEGVSCDGTVKADNDVSTLSSLSPRSESSDFPGLQFLYDEKHLGTAFANWLILEVAIYINK